MTTETDSTLTLEDDERDLILAQLSRVARHKVQTVFNPGDSEIARRTLRKFGCDDEGKPIDQTVEGKA